MRVLTPLRVVLLLVSSFAVTHSQCQNRAYDAAARSHIANVQILALSTSVHQGFAGNEDVFLAEVSFRGRKSVLAKLTDFYPTYESPIRHSELTQRHALRMSLRPDAECETTGGAFFLGAFSELFDAGVAERLSDDRKQVIPCFKVDHVATRLR